MSSQSNTTSHEPLFNIIDSFLEKVSFETSMEYFSTSEPNYVTHTFVELDEKFGSHNHYMVKIHTDIALMVEGEYTAFRLSVVFAAFVEVYGNHHEEMELHDILNYDVPQKLLNRIRTLVFQIIRESGYQYMPGDDTFSRPTHLDNENQVFMPLVPMPEGESDSKKETDQVFVPLPAFLKDEFDDEDDYGEEDNSAHEEYSLSFRSVIGAINSFEEGAEFLRTFSRALNDDVLGFGRFNQLPAFQTYYRFITPTSYHCPEIDDCDPELWPMLFRLLFGNTKADCELVDGKNSLPELVFNYGNYSDYRVSELDSADLNDLLSDLMTEALCEVSVKLLHRSTKASERELKWSVGQLITKEQFYKLHNFFPGTAQEEDRVFFEKLYSKIKECDIQTYLYRL